MKSIISILIISFNIYSQEILYGDDELFFYQDGGLHTYHFTPLNAVWDSTGALRTDDEWGPSVYNPLKLNLDGYVYLQTNTNGMDYILSSETYDIPVFGNSLYKVGCYADTGCTWEEASFFLDIRDCGYPNTSGGYNDFTIKYIQAQHKFYMVEGKGVQFNDSRFIDVTNKIVKLWNMEPITWSGISCYNNFWQNCLGIGTAINQKLKIIWDLNPNQSNITKYYLYRNVNNSGFTRIGEFNNQTFDYIDNSILYTDNGSSIVSYKVTSYNGTEYTSTNIAVQEYSFEFDWGNGLILTNNATHPKLVWGPHPTFSAAKYRVYRAVSNNPVNPASLSYNLIHQTENSSTFEFTDYAVTILPGYQYAYYYVVGWNGSNESAKTNYIGTPAEFQKPLIPELNQEIPKDFALYQNYPNPFNPSTKISWQSPVSGHQTLKVFDVLGNEVATLVNEFRNAGSYEINFQPTAVSPQLASGVYFYKLQAGDFVQTKKMLLMK